MSGRSRPEFGSANRRTPSRLAREETARIGRKVSKLDQGATIVGDRDRETPRLGGRSRSAEMTTEAVMLVDITRRVERGALRHVGLVCCTLVVDRANHWLCERAEQMLVFDKADRPRPGEGDDG